MTGFKGKLNIYTCDRCHGHVVTKDLDEGVPPFMVPCRSTVGCSGFIQSWMYRVFDQEMKPDLVWYRPSAVEVVPENLREHVTRGGLILGPATRCRMPPRAEVTPELRARLYKRFPKCPRWLPPTPEPAAAPWVLIRDVLAQGRKDGLDDTQIAGGVYTALASHGLLTGGRA